VRERESSLENQYFSAKDREALETLLKKMEVAQKAQKDEEAKRKLDAATSGTDVAKLKAIFRKYHVKLIPQFEQDLLAWKASK